MGPFAFGYLEAGQFRFWYLQGEVAKLTGTDRLSEVGGGGPFEAC